MMVPTTAFRVRHVNTDGPVSWPIIRDINDRMYAARPDKNKRL